MTYNPSPKLNELIHLAATAQEGFDNWDEGKTHYSTPFLPPRTCTLREVVRELDEANLVLVDFVLKEGQRLRLHLLDEVAKT